MTKIGEGAGRMRERPQWVKELMKWMVDSGMDFAGLAKALGVSVQYVSLLVLATGRQPASGRTIERMASIDVPAEIIKLARVASVSKLRGRCRSCPYHPGSAEREGES
jgi:hypothetical protein